LIAVGTVYVHLERSGGAVIVYNYIGAGCGGDIHIEIKFDTTDIWYPEFADDLASRFNKIISRGNVPRRCTHGTGYFNVVVIVKNSGVARSRNLCERRSNRCAIYERSKLPSPSTSSGANAARRGRDIRTGHTRQLFNKNGALGAGGRFATPQTKLTVDG
jgi:hypothetical protein